MFREQVFTIQGVVLVRPSVSVIINIHGKNNYYIFMDIDFLAYYFVCFIFSIIQYRQS